MKKNPKYYLKDIQGKYSKANESTPLCLWHGVHKGMTEKKIQFIPEYKKRENLEEIRLAVAEPHQAGGMINGKAIENICGNMEILCKSYEKHIYTYSKTHKTA